MAIRYQNSRAFASHFRDLPASTFLSVLRKGREALWWDIQQIVVNLQEVKWVIHTSKIRGLSHSKMWAASKANN